ncbi:hypothetical protein ACOMHN_054700 [Nucella lapillus]
MFLRGGVDIQLLRCGDVEANPGPNPEPSTSRPSTSLRQTRISTPRKSSQSAKDPSLSEVMAMLNSINSSLNDKMDGMTASLNGKMDGVKEDVGQLHQEFGTLSELGRGQHPSQAPSSAFLGSLTWAQPCRCPHP